LGLYLNRAQLSHIKEWLVVSRETYGESLRLFKSFTSMDRIRFFQLMDGLDGNTPIRQYLKLDYLLQLLESGSYYVKRKRKFEDKRECSLPLKSLFHLQPVGNTAYKCLDDKYMGESLEKFRNYSKSSNILTSCWTERVGESALMWKNFVDNRGACIKTNINNFVASFVKDDYEICCGRMSYNGYHAEQDYLEALFSKERYFAEEKEIRFYFTPRDGYKENILDDHVSMPVNTNVLIDEIILSPYIKPMESEQLVHDLSRQYEIKVSSSKIELTYETVY
jgi:hypothetical protein